MPVAPEIERLLAAINAQPPMHQVPLDLLRRTRERIDASDFQPVGKVEDRSMPGPGGTITLRLYRPESAAGKLPLVLLFHGGGFVFGGVDGYYDHVCRVLCADARCTAVSVAYRLAPENKFPAAPDDCYAALQWTVEHADELGIDTRQVFVAGGSAGANLAAVTAMRARDAGGPALRGQILFYPIVDFHTPASASSLAFANGYYLTRADVIWFWRQYLRDEDDSRNPYAVPLQARDLAGLPPALVITAEYDPLRDGGEHYAQRLRDRGVAVESTRYAGMVHGFMAFPTGKAAMALQESVRWVRSRALSQGDCS